MSGRFFADSSCTWQVDGPGGVRPVLRLLCAHCAADDFLLSLFLELLLSLEDKAPVIHAMAVAAVCASPEQVPPNPLPLPLTVPNRCGRNIV